MTLGLQSRPAAAVEDAHDRPLGELVDLFRARVMVDTSEPGRPSRDSEAWLFSAYRRGSGLDIAALEERVEVCACSGEIGSIDVPRAIRYAVELHNESPRHVALRARDEPVPGGI